ncbi:MAG TPA: hypothetical protein ENL16_00020 [Candidatus Woesearchaeota archaeon]|nr:hypothetical protein [Candidatus Woesearchaeota archaeon]
MLPIKEYLTKEGWKQDLEGTKKDWQKIKETLTSILNVLYWDFYYTVGYSSTAGLGNGLANIKNNKSFSAGFGEAYTNNFPLGMAINLIYPVIFNQLKKTKHYRLYANLLTVGVNLGFLGWHYITGTEHPIQTMMPNFGIGLLMANKHVSETKTLESRLR